MIRFATRDDISWISENCLKDFNEKYTDGQISIEEMAKRYSDWMNKGAQIIVYEDKSAFINLVPIVRKNKKYQFVNGWWSNKKGSGMKLLKLACDFAMREKLIQFSFLEKLNEEKLIRVLDKLGYKIRPYKDKILAFKDFRRCT